MVIGENYEGVAQKYWRHFFTAAMIAKSSRTYVEARRTLGLKGLMKNAMGCPFYDNMAPIPTPEASVSTVKGNVKSGSMRTRAVVRAAFKSLKVV